MYTEPEWGEATSKSGFFEVLKEGRIIETIPIEVGTSLISFGRLPDNTIKLDHDSISRKHAILQFGPRNSAFIYDLESTHGTFLNKERAPSLQYIKIASGNVLIQFGASTRKYLLHLDETSVEEARTEFKNEDSFYSLVLPFFESHDIQMNSIQILKTETTFSCSFDFSDYISIDSPESLRIISSGTTREEASENFYEDCFNFLSRLNLIERKHPTSDSDSETENDTDEELLNGRIALKSTKDALSEQQLLELRSRFKADLENINSEIDKASKKLMALEQEIVEDFDVYIQDLKKAELQNDIGKLNVKLKEAQKEFDKYDSILNLIGSHVPSNTSIPLQSEAPLIQETRTFNKPATENSKKIKIEAAKQIIEAQEEKEEILKNSEDEYENDFEDSTIHDEKVNVDELKRKYGY